MSENNTHYSDRKRLQKNKLSPLQPVTFITEKGPTVLLTDEISVKQIGWKAYGLASLPPEWIPPFFVISASCFEQEISNETIDSWTVECIVRTVINPDASVMVRSSGISETMRTRGQLQSTFCLPSQVTVTIRDLILRVPKTTEENVHWIIQEYVPQKEKGHLSNERRLKEEDRDWVVEFEPQMGRHGFSTPIAVRRWRDGTILSDLDLSCSSVLAITLCLRRVAMWATQLSSRTHFEWVWDGRVVHIVQIELEEPTDGVNPQSLLPNKIQSVQPASLNVFHPATQENFECFGKLRNAKVYGELGYDMPIFYVLDNPCEINRVLSGQIDPQLEGDLIELTKRPLIIRTDGVRIPDDKREMLPRSEELRTYTDAKNWLLDNFRSRIVQNGLIDSEPCLIAHHFIPSVASAWARAEPGNRIVRIESLWGIPEGLYWYSHDTFEVDTQVVDIGLDQQVELLKYTYLKRRRYKGTFIAPNNDGKWIPYQTAPPHDWNKSISNKSWLFEIANTTRRVAEREKHAVSVMWFIDNHPQATKHKVLPWFHGKSELAGPPKAAPRKKSKSARDFILKTIEDWRRLQEDIKSGKHIERVVVEPIETELIRNPEFAKELADLAASNRFVVELSGGILSHAYYILQSRGAQVECIDLFGAQEDVVEFNKVVRDKVPSVISGRGERAETVQLKGDALVFALREKLVEEAFEALDAKSGTELIGEIADIQEVVRALVQTLGLNTGDIESEREEKKKRRGGFEKGLMLIRTATPHSIRKEPATPEPPALGLKTLETSVPVFSDAADLPGKPMYRRPDFRQVDQEFEKLFTFETEMNKIGEIKESLKFSMPMDNELQREFTLSVELRRARSAVRGAVRLRLRPLQLEFDFRNR